MREPAAAPSFAAIASRPRIFDSTDAVERVRGPLRALDHRIVSLYVDHGLSSRAIGREVHLSSTAVLRRLAALGVARRAPGGSAMRLRDGELRRTAFLYERLELSLAAVGALEGIHPNAVRHRLRAAGVVLRPPGTRRTIPRAS